WVWPCSTHGPMDLWTHGLVQSPDIHRVAVAVPSIFMLDTLLAKVFGTQNERELKKIRPIVDQINALEQSTRGLTDAQLRDKTAEFRTRVANGESLDDLLPEAFAV